MIDEAQDECSAELAEQQDRDDARRAEEAEREADWAMMSAAQEHDLLEMDLQDSIALARLIAPLSRDAQAGVWKILGKRAEVVAEAMATVAREAAEDALVGSFPGLGSLDPAELRRIAAGDVDDERTAAAMLVLKWRDDNLLLRARA